MRTIHKGSTANKRCPCYTRLFIIYPVCVSVLL